MSWRQVARAMAAARSAGCTRVCVWVGWRLSGWVGGWCPWGQLAVPHLQPSIKPPRKALLSWLLAARCQPGWHTALATPPSLLTLLIIAAAAAGAADTRIGKPDRLAAELKQERKELGNYCADLLER